MGKLFGDIKKESASESLNEDAGTVVAAILVLWNLITIGISVIKYRMAVKIDNENFAAIEKEVNAYADKYKEPKEFRKKIDSIRMVSVDELAKRSILEEKDAKLCKYNDVVPYAIFDKNDFILAYALFAYSMSTDIIHGYGIKICDTSIRHTPELAFYIRARFEMTIRYYGPGLFKVLNGKYMNSKYSGYVGSSISKDITPMEMSVEEFEAVADDMERIINKIAYGIETLLPKYKKLYDRQIHRVNSSDMYMKHFKKYNKTVLYMTSYIKFSEESRYMSDKEFMDTLGKSVKDIGDLIKKEGFELTTQPNTDAYWGNSAITSTKSCEDHPYFTIIMFIKDGCVNVQISSNKTFLMK